jgi:hypothetical protein
MESKTEKDLIEGVDYIKISMPDLSSATVQEIESLESIDDIPKKEIRLFNSIKPYRLEFETQEEFKFRRRLNNKLIKSYLNGKRQS